MLLGSSVANKPIRLSLEAETLASLVRNAIKKSDRLCFILIVLNNVMEAKIGAETL